MEFKLDGLSSELVGLRFLYPSFGLNLKTRATAARFTLLEDMSWGSVDCIDLKACNILVKFVILFL